MHQWQFFIFYRLNLAWMIVPFVIEAFQPHEVPFIIVGLCACAMGILLRKSFPVPMTLRLFLTFSPIRFRVSDLMLRALPIWNWVLYTVIKTDLFVFFNIQSSSLTSPICWRCWLFYSVYIWYIVKSEVSIDVWN